MAEEIINLVELEGIDLDVTAFVFPFDRGCEYTSVEIRQGGDRFEEFQKLREAMQDEFAGGLTLHIEYESAQGEKRELDIKQIQLVDLTKEDEGPTGTRIVIASVKYLLQFAPMAQSWNLLYQNLYQADSAQTTLEPKMLLNFLSELPAISPKVFANRMDFAAIEDVSDLQDAELPPDQLTGGRAFTAALQKLLEQWAVDLCFTAAGQFYFANRADLPSGTLAHLEAMGETLDWIGEAPDLSQPPSTVQIPKYVYVPYWEDHNLETPFAALPNEKATGDSKTQELISKTGYPHGMLCRQIFELGDTYVYLDELLAALGFTGTLFETSDSEPHSLGAVLMNPTLFDSPLSPAGHSADEDDYQARVAAVSIIKNDGRRLFSVEPDNASLRGAWMNIRPGLMDGSGVIVDARPVGAYIQFFNRSPDDLPKPDAKSPKLGEQFFATDDDKNATRMPFAVNRVHDGELLVRLEYKNYDGVPKADGAMIGIARDPDSLYLWREKASSNRRVRKAIERSGANLPLNLDYNIRENIELQDGYNFAIYCVGRRYFPNDASKWWTIKVDIEADFGIKGDLEEVTLSPSEELFCRRDHLHYFESVFEPSKKPILEDARPNGNDGFGLCMNRAALIRDARRRARAYVESLINKAGPTLKFAEIAELASVRVLGHIDSWALHVNGAEFHGEVAVGPRPSEAAMVRQAFSEQAARKTDLGGKKFK